MMKSHLRLRKFTFKKPNAALTLAQYHERSAFRVQLSERFNMQIIGFTKQGGYVLLRRDLLKPIN